MDWNGSVFTLISLRSFSSIWYWIGLALSWSIISQHPLGVPFDMVLRARRRGGADLQDLEAMIRIQIRRRQTIMDQAGPLIVAVSAAFLSGLSVLGFVYGIEIAQAMTLMLLPMALVGALRVRLMTQLAAGQIGGEALCKRLTWHRTGVQAIGLIAILLTAAWGMWFNLSFRALGG